MSGRQLLAFMMTSLDGSHEHADDGLGWMNLAEDFAAYSIRQLDSVDGLVFGRRTYEGMVAYWTGRGVTESPEIAERMTRLPKYVCSTSLRDPGWHNVTVLSTEPLKAVAAMKAEPGRGLVVFGSSQLTAGLLAEGLVDELRVMVSPVLLDGGSPLLRGIGRRVPLELLRATTFRSGNVLVCYRPGVA